MKQFGLLQHVRETTHRSGGILDLVITTDDTIIRNLQVQPPTISDHSFVNLILPSLHLLLLHRIRMIRGWKSLDYDAFRKAIQDSRLSSEPSLHDAASLDDLFDLCSSTMTQLINKVLPLRKSPPDKNQLLFGSMLTVNNIAIARVFLKDATADLGNLLIASNG